MKIGIVAGLAEGQKTGIGSYTLNLVKGLKEVDYQNEYFLLLRKEMKCAPVDQGHQIVLPLPMFICNMKGNFLLWQFFLLPLKLRRSREPVVTSPQYGPDMFSIFDVPGKKIISIHDVAPILELKSWDRISVALHKLLLPKVLKRVDRIITVSHFSKGEIVRHLKVNPDRINVIYQGIDEAFRVNSRQQVTSVVSKYKLPQDFILYVGLLHRQKNIPALIKAYAQLKRAGTKHKLVVAGGKVFGGDNTLFSLVENLELQKDVIFTGYVPDEDLAALYNAASVFAFPSLYEGFGLPPLEAMACGTPVVTSNRASLPEVVGDAALTVDPYDIDSLAEAINRLITDNGLRQEMIQRGLERVKAFSCQEAAKATLKVYQEVLEHG